MPSPHPVRIGLYLAELGLTRQRGGRLGTLHARGGCGKGPHAVTPMAPHFGDWTPGLGCAPHVCRVVSVSL